MTTPVPGIEALRAAILDAYDENAGALRPDGRFTVAVLSLVPSDPAVPAAAVLLFGEGSHRAALRAHHMLEGTTGNVLQRDSNCRDFGPPTPDTDPKRN